MYEALIFMPRVGLVCSSDFVCLRDSLFFPNLVLLKKLGPLSMLIFQAAPFLQSHFVCIVSRVCNLLNGDWAISIIFKLSANKKIECLRRPLEFRFGLIFDQRFYGNFWDSCSSGFFYEFVFWVFFPGFLFFRLGTNWSQTFFNLKVVIL